MQYQAPQHEGFLQTLPAFMHQAAVRLDLDPQALQFHQFGEDVGGAVEQRAGQHRALDSPPVGIGLGLVGVAHFRKAVARHVDAVLNMIEKASGEGFDQLLLGHQGVSWRAVGLDPVAVVKHPLLAVDDLFGAIGNHRIHAG